MEKKNRLIFFRTTTHMIKFVVSLKKLKFVSTDKDVSDTCNLHLNLSGTEPFYHVYNKC